MVSYLKPREQLSAGQSLSSPNGQYSLHMQTDGNLVLYKNNNEVKWATYTNTKGGVRAVMEFNLNIYNNSNTAVFSTNIKTPVLFESFKDRAYLQVQDDGNLVIYSDEAIWGYVTLKQPDPNQVNLYIPSGTTILPGTTYSNGDYRMAFQTDGNLVIYKGASTVVWATYTQGKGALKAVIQGDGNFVIYGANNRVLWHSNTPERPGSYLNFTNYGRLFVNQPKPIWGLFGVPAYKPVRVIEPSEPRTFPIYIWNT
ncbi:hypothetical protein [Pseudomonas pseudonitroreducens]|uniref:hypothetical protein n=1 Tax=Pseudomonas pseudonitroreducens TaxID=2892326 RepID=UPI001F203CC1|nr:hypothetical protein [Pseudomonas pseudonitroreducens]